MASEAIAFYLVAYFITTIGAFGVVTVLSDEERDADTLEDYAGLFWRRPMLASIFTLMLLSLAGIPVTAGFLAKFYVVTAGASAGIWGLILILVITSVIGLFYYLRVVVTMYARVREEAPHAEPPHNRWKLCPGGSYDPVGLGGRIPGSSLECDQDGAADVSRRALLKTNDWKFVSRAGFIDHCFPDAFGFENEFNGFADRAVAGESFRNVVGGLFYLGDGIAHGNGEASAAHQGNIRKIIADISDSRIGDARFLEGFLHKPAFSPAVSCR